MPTQSMCSLSHYLKSIGVCWKVIGRFGCERFSLNVLLFPLPVTIDAVCETLGFILEGQGVQTETEWEKEKEISLHAGFCNHNHESVLPTQATLLKHTVSWEMNSYLIKEKTWHPLRGCHSPQDVHFVQKKKLHWGFHDHYARHMLNGMQSDDLEGQPGRPPPNPPFNVPKGFLYFIILYLCLAAKNNYSSIKVKSECLQVVPR